MADNEAPHTLRSGLPLFRFMDIDVMPLLRYPSAVRDDDRRRQHRSNPAQFIPCEEGMT
ncbi:hypothetical protein ACFOVS_20750 [Rhizobium lemnae]|uniref:Uncharacterized protein n=1 Tax=Rhizobium lemnae TaxID=1214924 RepID=A0ABV8ED89_9HYPH